MTTPELQAHEALSAFVEEAARKHRVPGVSVGVLHDGRAYAAPYGVTKTDDPLPVDADTLFHIGSTTKTLTATALMRLVDDGRATLKDRVVDHLPDFAVADAEATQTVTLGHLLNHTAGWRGDALPRTGFGDDALALAMPVVAAGPQEFPPGAHASYNNAALLVAGRVLEILTGQSYEQAVTELVLTPLALTSTFFLPWEVTHRRFAAGHLLRPESVEPVEIWLMHRAMGPAGGAISSLRDQLTYAGYHLDGTTAGTPPLAESTRLLMQEPTVEMRSGHTGVGLTWLLSDHGDVRLVSHGGNVSNLQTSAFHLAPDHGLAVVTMGNSAGGTALGADVLAWSIEHFLGRPPRSPLPTQPFPADLLQEYVGTYDLGPWSMAVTADAGKLYAQMVLPDDSPEEHRVLFEKPPVEMALVGPDQITRAADPLEVTADFVRDDTGRVKWFRSGMRLAPRREEPP